MTPKKQDAPATPTPQPQPETPKQEAVPVAPPVAATAPATPSKQETTLQSLLKAWASRGVDVSKVEVNRNAKTWQINVGADWPLIEVGTAGGVVLPQIRSYGNAFQAALEGDQLWKKQQERDQRKAAGGTAAPVQKSKEQQAAELRKLITDAQSKLTKLEAEIAAQPKPEAPKPDAPKPTPTAKKQKAHAEIEKQLQTQAG